MVDSIVESAERRLVVERRPGWIVLRGRIDESARLDDLAVDATIEAAVDIDLAGVTYINSLGVRDWVSLLRRFAARGVAITLHRVSEPMVHQMNMILDVKGAATVESLHAPFVCDACGWEGTVALRVDEVTKVIATVGAPAAPCSECGATARFGDYVDRYFLFLC